MSGKTRIEIQTSSFFIVMFATGKRSALPCAALMLYTTMQHSSRSQVGKGILDVNVEGSRIAAEEAARANVGCFVHMSSSAIYGAPSEIPIQLTTPDLAQWRLTAGPS